MPLSAPGIGSGLDVKAMVEAIVKAEITPLQVRHDKQLTYVNAEISAIGQVKSALSNLKTSLNNLAELSNFYSMQSTTSDPSFFSVSLSSNAAKGSYQVEVQYLAQNQTLASAYFPNNNSPVGSGNININFGTYSNGNTTFTPNPDVSPVSIYIDPSNNSLASISNAINNAGVGVTANIIQDSQGSRIILTSDTSGQSYAMQISGDIAALNYDPTTNVTAMTQTMAGQDSTILINGLKLTQNSNTIKNAISGVTLNLQKALIGSPVTLTINQNQDQPTALVNDFIKQYNDVMNTIYNLTGYNKDTKQGGYLQGDSQLRNLKSNLAKLATSPSGQINGPIQSLADLGITTNDQGLLELDQDTYADAIKNHFDSIGTLFAKSAVASNNYIIIDSIGASVPAGVYQVVLTEYTPGVSMQGTIGTYSASSTDGVTLNGSGQLEDLSIDILSGSLGNIGQITITDGLASTVSNFLDTYLDPKGDLNERTDQLKKEVKDLDSLQARILNRTEELTIKYMRQFNALDLLLANLQNQSKSLSEMLNSLPKPNNHK